MKHPNQWAVGEVIDKLTIRFLCSNPTKDEVLATDFLTSFFAQSLYAFLKTKLIITFYPQKLLTART